jgi:hypothetical protein
VRARLAEAAAARIAVLDRSVRRCGGVQHPPQVWRLPDPIAAAVGSALEATWTGALGATEQLPALDVELVTARHKRRDQKEEQRQTTKREH